MPYTSPITIDDFDYLSLTKMTPEVIHKIRKALETNQKVEWQYSSFTDPGEDWSQILIAGKPVPGTYSIGY